MRVFFDHSFHLAQKHQLFVLADEVYQENTYLPDLQFHSFKKVLMDLGGSFKNMEMGKENSTII